MVYRDIAESELCYSEAKDLCRASWKKMILIIFLMIDLERKGKEKIVFLTKAEVFF